MSSMGGGSASDTMFTLLRLFDSPKDYKAKLDEFARAEKEAEEAKKGQAERDAKAQKALQQATALHEEAIKKATAAGVERDRLAELEDHLADRDRKQSTKAAELAERETKLRNAEAKLAKDKDDFEKLSRQRHNTMVNQENEIGQRRAENERLHLELQDKLERIRALAK